MDKVQLVLGYLRKYHFWLLCVVAIGASLMGWSMARGTLSEEYKKGKSKIESTFGSLNQIQGEANPPNDSWKEAIDKLTVEGRAKVKDAWEAVYKEQQKVLSWPEDILGPQFIEWIETKKVDDIIPTPWRQQYRNQVVNVEFPKLLEIVDAKLETSDSEAEKVVDTSATPRLYKVEWEDSSQDAVQRSLQMDDKEIPSSEVVRLRQEDLWVFRALLNIIRQTNEDAKYSSHVKQIHSLSIGADAAGKFQDGMKPTHITLLTTESGEPGGQVGGQEESMDGEQAPDAGRYVGEDGNPLAAGVAATEQFKRLPVYMNLEMNQNEITKLLTHCANYPLPVEVKQLRINPKLDESRAKSSEPPSASDSSAMSLTAKGPLDVTVEIHGIIYIYNPPDPTKLGMPDESESAIGG